MFFTWLTITALLQQSWLCFLAQVVTSASGTGSPPLSSTAVLYYGLQQKIASLLEILHDDCKQQGDITDLSTFQNVSQLEATEQWYRSQIAKGETLLDALKEDYHVCIADMAKSGQLGVVRRGKSGREETDRGVGRRWCRTSPQVMNLAHYYMAVQGAGSDNGHVQKLSYTKSQCYTDIRVQWYGTVRAHYSVEGCGRWRVLFNGNECADPGPIEVVDYQHKKIDNHHMIEIDGICRGIGKGLITIALYVGACTGYSVSDSYTGWNNPRHIMVYEIDRREDFDKSCPGLSLFNENQDASKIEDGSDTAGHVVRTLTFTKTDEETGIYIQYNSVAAIVYHNKIINYCGRWYATFNGEECADPAPIDMIFRPTTNGNGAFNHRDKPFRHYSMHGICGGFQKGQVKIEIRIGPCYTTPKAHRPDMLSGWNSMSRLMAQEVREHSPIKEVFGSNGHLEKLPMFNIAQHVWMNINSDVDSGLIRSVDYVKTDANTGLRLTWMGDHRHYARGHSCGRWFFTIDGAECSNPGRISGVSYYNHEIDYHYPGTVSGICYGITAGKHTIQYNVGKCPNYSVYDSYTGWMSSSRMIIMEVHVTTFRKCLNAHGC